MRLFHRAVALGSSLRPTIQLPSTPTCILPVDPGPRVVLAYPFMSSSSNRIAKPTSSPRDDLEESRV
jgi:hypothetical protein